MDYQTVWAPFLPFKSVNFTQKFLRALYEKNKVDEPLSYSYKNGYTFCYYIDHGRKFYQQAESAPYEIKPVLLFYGAVQLIKAVLLSIDEKYPRNTEVLAHGLSTRKRKSQNYEFSQDTVHIQKRGLFSYTAQTLFHLGDLEGLKFKMEDLMMRIPDMQQLFLQMRERITCRPITKQNDSTYKTSQGILDDLHMTSQRFFQFLDGDLVPVERNPTTELYFKFANKRGFSSLFYIQKDLYGHYYLPSFRKGFFELPELLVHLILLYNLSMISRYETEWWSDLHLHHTSIDLPFIHRFIDLTPLKFPQMIAEHLSLNRENIINK
ncbi:hypothetical protein JOD43_002330 [Pullulanibacillus pueri]|uniref:YaaC-like Protein n=1 Tax=Pullulanibacillus pueri TaxID=1437324 RepID=A0A8J3ELS3_9BACL|nr:YaaC family protein [Pullulanibacillus pueri]MBM7682157.1 hypothetical protein [Pullulanibacillus pueri]GGH80254.1 hypothetical protein GCM10007096_16380 [Pullulanibacillus pueri]